MSIKQGGMAGYGGGPRGPRPTGGGSAAGSRSTSKRTSPRTGTSKLTTVTGRKPTKANPSRLNVVTEVSKKTSKRIKDVTGKKMITKVGRARETKQFKKDRELQAFSEFVTGKKSFPDRLTTKRVARTTFKLPPESKTSSKQLLKDVQAGRKLASRPGVKNGMNRVVKMAKKNVAQANKKAMSSKVRKNAKSN